MEQISQIHHSINQLSPSVLATYSVSFCDKFVKERTCSDSEEEDETRDNACLLNSGKLKNCLPSTSIPPVAVSASKSVRINRASKRNFNVCCQCHSRYSYPCPVSQSAPEFESSDTTQYGASVPSDSLTNGKATDTLSSSNTHRVVYCVHGKPSGCCASLVSISGEDGTPEGNPATRLSTDTITIYDEHYCHNEERGSVDHKARKKLIIASILCIIFMIGEIIGGYLSSSLAIATDAAHLLTDFASFMISLFSLWVAGRPATQSMPFGWYRAEVIGALTSVLMIWIVTGILVYMAVERIIKQDFEIDAPIMLITSALGVVVNIIMAFSLHQHGHSHGGKSVAHAEDGEEHAHQKHRDNINVRAAFIHVIGDFIQSFGVFVAAIVIYFKPEYRIVDPICTFLFSILVLITTFAIIRDTMVVLMEGIPSGVNFTDVLNTFLSIDGVVKVHNLRIWALSLDKTALSAHLAVRPGVNSSQILKSASRKIHNKFNFFEMTLQIEEFHEQMENCAQCQPPAK